MNPIRIDESSVLGSKFASQLALQEELDNRGPWYDHFHFTNGAITNGRSPSATKLASLGLPVELGDIKILDVGAYEGYYSVQMAQRGALVTSNDHYIWNVPGDKSRKNFEFIKEITGAKIQTLEAQIWDLPASDHQITLFLGVLYHLEDQIGALRKIRETATQMVVLETLVDALDQDGPSLKYYPGSKLNLDPTNQFGANFDTLVGMFQESGYRSWDFKSLWDINTTQSLDWAGNKNLNPVKSGRAVFWLYP
jgi:tRNA (mo5U34)-methyltransferase